MPLLTQGKTNWKFLLIVVVFATVVGGGVFWYSRGQIKPLTGLTQDICSIDSDCQFYCGCGCVLKNTPGCPNPDFACEYDSCNSCRCLNGQCVSWSEVFIEAQQKKDINLCQEIQNEDCKEQCLEVVTNLLEDETADWQTYRSEDYGFEMEYPENFFSPYHQTKTEMVQCDYDNFEDDCPAEIITINGKPFCLEKTGGAALGTAYTTYNYATVIDKECFIVSFTVPFPACSNYLPDEEAYNECQLDNEVTKPETINKIVSTFRFIETTEGFCGWSTQGSCTADFDCLTSGCSGEVCGSKNEEPFYTTCEWKDCYDDEAYGVECKCVDNKCQWIK